MFACSQLFAKFYRFFELFRINSSYFYFGRRPMASKVILVTGAAGYIGCHCVLTLLTRGYDVVALDDCSNACLTNDQNLPECLRRVELLANKKLKDYIFGDMCNELVVQSVFKKYRFDGVIHLAAFKSVTESIGQSMHYYDNNLKALLNLVEQMQKFETYRLVLASSGQVYGKPKYLPIDELHPTGQSLTSPYSKSVFMIEQVLHDLCLGDPKWTIVSLRIFNTSGAHSSGEIGEDPPTVPKNLMPYITQVSIGRRPELRVYGSDYQTSDGTGVRDYVHVDDVCDAIASALNKIISEKWSQWYAFNIGTGAPHSVLQVISTFETISGDSIPHQIVDRRDGDIGQSYANITLSEEILNWKPKRTLEDICRTAHKWQKQNPKGFERPTNK